MYPEPAGITVGTVVQLDIESYPLPASAEESSLSTRATAEMEQTIRAVMLFMLNATILSPNGFIIHIITTVDKGNRKELIPVRLKIHTVDKSGPKSLSPFVFIRPSSHTFRSDMKATRPDHSSHTARCTRPAVAGDGILRSGVFQSLSGHNNG